MTSTSIPYSTPSAPDCALRIASSISSQAKPSQALRQGRQFRQKLAQSRALARYSSPSPSSAPVLARHAMPRTCMCSPCHQSIRRISSHITYSLRGTKPRYRPLGPDPAPPPHRYRIIALPSCAHKAAVLQCYLSVTLRVDPCAAGSSRSC